ncbi:transmembrane protein 145 [Trichonephila clavipes]|nr:transmembrane protein 145 [Trichonephila clavipes]
MRDNGDGSNNFEPQSSDEGNSSASTSLSKLHTKSTRGLSTDLMGLSPSSRWIFSGPWAGIPHTPSSRKHFEIDCNGPQVKFGDRGKMLWGYFSRFGLDHLVDVQGTIKTEAYLNILGKFVLPSGLYLRYRITMTNDEHNLWFKHFSADQLYILQVDICFLVLYVVLLLMSFVEMQALRARHLFHRTYALYLVSVVLECMGLGFLCAYYAIYAQEGTSRIELKLIGLY